MVNPPASRIQSCSSHLVESFHQVLTRGRGGQNVYDDSVGGDNKIGRQG